MKDINRQQKDMRNALLQMNLWPWPLDTGFSLSVVKKRYYEMAFHLHPDKKGSKEEFINLRNAYDFLVENYNKNSHVFNEIFSEKKAQAPSDEEKQNNKDESEEIFQIYKKAAAHYSKALEEYFDKTKQVNLNANDENYLKLKEKLKYCKDLLAKVIKSDPSGIWASDAIEKIARINVWLQNENHQ
ncbi:MAG: hypothetical protein OEZ22_08880 [Spirochaetia bacterium]|nr:hypothetical protein [Spirochaetia bacterium]